jgi:hypothetical protein
MDKQLTSRSKQPLTQYKYGVKYTVKTPDQKYEIDGDTAQKLADVLISPDIPKFIKFRTEQGQVVLNVSSIMGISLDEAMAKQLINFMKQLPTYGVDYKNPDQMYSLYRGKRLEGGNHYADRATFDYYYHQAVR